MTIQTKIKCCKGEYHVLMNGRYYCMAPPNIQCQQLNKDEGKFTRGVKKIPYCSHQLSCTECSETFGNAGRPGRKQSD